jgi:hypothetical protein
MPSLLSLTKSYIVHRLHRALNLGNLEEELAHCRRAADNVSEQLGAGGAIYAFIRQGQMVSPQPELSFVCSRGRTGTQWLTEVLNLHPDILAAHGPGAPPFWFPGKPSARIRASEDRQWHSRIGDLSFAQARAEMRRVGEARYYALVHALTLPELAAKLGNEVSFGRVAAVNLVRHPVPRINSFHAEWLLGDTPHYQLVRAYLIRRWHHEAIFTHYRDRILQKFDVDFRSLRDILFVIACHWLRYDLQDFEYPVRHFAFEKLVSDRSCVAELLRSCFGPAFSISDEYLEAVGRVRRRNARSFMPLDVRDAYAAWSEWQKYCFSVVFEDIDLRRVYNGFEYDFSFLSDPADRRTDRGYRAAQSDIAMHQDRHPRTQAQDIVPSGRADAAE